ncbi:hypothetical protein [Xanthomonas vesicatoria]|uniref:hypothetical protein n=1 Tax=Xanthomonas vesicatoria TaxID=56460 RepID=UPI001E41F0CB|nr:hypothetical protein [Xanthomonas vesicatoria]MCC8627680.1 hypothetical protein [Xanthomonas vesicatoria]MDG4484708.1 hypothetical protein [Xanthomonas vesicatoria]
MSDRRRVSIEQARRHLERDGWPRVQMSAIVLITATGGLLASFLLRNAGVDAMAVRYPIATLFAYGVFLLLMWAWLRWRNDIDGDVVEDCVDLGSSAAQDTSGWAGHGGNSSGAGRSGTWSTPSGSTSDVLGDSELPAFVDGDAALPIVAVVIVLAAAAVAIVAAAWVVWSAPVLMAELVVDAALAGGLYRRMRGVQAQGWWWLCVRHTLWPLIGVLAFFLVVGAVAQHKAPQATTLVEALRGR